MMMMWGYLDNFCLRVEDQLSHPSIISLTFMLSFSIELHVACDVISMTVLNGDYYITCEYNT